LKVRKKRREFPAPRGRIGPGRVGVRKERSNATLVISRKKGGGSRDKLRRRKREMRVIEALPA